MKASHPSKQCKLIIVKCCVKEKQTNNNTLKTAVSNNPENYNNSTSIDDNHT